MSQPLGNRCSAWAGRLAVWTVILLTAQSAMAAAVPADPADAVYVGDTVIIAADGVELGLKDKVAVVLDAGTELRVTEVRGVWIGGYAVVDGQRHTGWVHRREVRLAGVEPSAVARVEAPDMPDDPQAAAALREFEVDLILNAAGNAASADATESKLDDDGLMHLQGLAQLSILDLSGRPVTDQGVQSLPLSKSLQELYLNDTQVSDRALEHLAGLVNLEILTLANTRVTGAALESLTKLRNLNVLNLSGCEVGDDDLKALAAISQLEVLVLAETSVTSDGLIHLTPLNRLRVLNLIGCQIDDIGLMHLQPLENLRMLYVENTQVTEDGVEALNEVAPSLAIFD